MKLQTILSARGWSQRKLADESGITQEQVNRFCCGRAKPSADNLGLLADALGCSTDAILGRGDGAPDLSTVDTAALAAEVARRVSP